MVQGSQTATRLNQLFIGNRWINSVFSEYGIIKQRILLQIIEQLQPKITTIRLGLKKTEEYAIPLGHAAAVTIDMSRIVKYNNYHIVRQYLTEMVAQPIQIYNDTSYKEQIYVQAPLIVGWAQGDKQRLVNVGIDRRIYELLLHIKYDWSKEKNKKVAQHYTMFDSDTIAQANCKYVFPMYTMLCSWGAKGGVPQMKVKDLRYRLQIEDSYKDWYSIHRFIIRPVQQLLLIYGQYGFNYTLHKDGKEIDSITFKVFKNKPNPDHAWKKIHELFQGEAALPYFARMSPEDIARLNYLLDEEKPYDLVKVKRKLEHIHSQLIRKRDNNQAAKHPFKYLWISITEEFPPPV